MAQDQHVRVDGRGRVVHGLDAPGALLECARGLRADGSDVALVDVEVVDAEGNRCPTALNLISFSVSGPAEWRGGIAQGPDNYILAKDLPATASVQQLVNNYNTAVTAVKAAALLQ